MTRKPLHGWTEKLPQDYVLLTQMWKNKQLKWYTFNIFHNFPLPSQHIFKLHQDFGSVFWQLKKYIVNELSPLLPEVSMKCQVNAVGLIPADPSSASCAGFSPKVVQGSRPAPWAPERRKHCERPAAPPQSFPTSQSSPGGSVCDRHPHKYMANGLGCVFKGYPLMEELDWRHLLSVSVQTRWFPWTPAGEGDAFVPVRRWDSYCSPGP